MGYEDAARACQAYIDANLDKELTLESIAKALNFSTIWRGVRPGAWSRAIARSVWNRQSARNDVKMCDSIRSSS